MAIIKVFKEDIREFNKYHGGDKVQPSKRLTLDFGIPDWRLGGFPDSETNQLQRGTKLSQKAIERRKADEAQKWEKAAKKSLRRLKASK